MADRLGATLGISLAVGASLAPAASSAAGPVASSAAPAATGGALGGALGGSGLGVIAFLLGVGAGVGGSQLLAEPPPQVANLSVPTVVVTVVAATPPPPPPEQTTPPIVDDAAPVATATASASAARPAGTRDVDLAAERALLELSRTALARGKADAAIRSLRLHASRYPRGRLSEERESLLIQALVAAGKRNEAKKRAKQFRKQSPNSMLLPGVNSVLEAPASK